MMFYFGKSVVGFLIRCKPINYVYFNFRVYRSMLYLFVVHYTSSIIILVKFVEFMPQPTKIFSAKNGCMHACRCSTTMKAHHADDIGYLLLLVIEHAMWISGK